MKNKIIGLLVTALLTSVGLLASEIEKDNKIKKNKNKKEKNNDQK